MAVNCYVNSWTSHLERGVRGSLRVPPDRALDHRMREHTARIRREVLKQRILSRSQAHLAPRDTNLAMLEVDSQVAGADRRFVRRPCDAAKRRTHPGEQLVHAERLG